MFIKLIYPTHHDLILISSIIRFSVFANMIKITLSEIDVKNDSVWNYGVTASRSIDVTQESQPLGYKQIQEYLKINPSL